MSHRESDAMPAYIRFVTMRTNAASGYRDGPFRTAYALCKDPAAPRDDADALARCLAWPSANVAIPSRFTSSTSKGAYRRRTKGLSWLKSDAREIIRVMREMAAILERNGHPVEMLKTRRPGRIVWEDEVQIVAEPFADTPR